MRFCQESELLSISANVALSALPVVMAMLPLPRMRHLKMSGLEVKSTFLTSIMPCSAFLTLMHGEPTVAMVCPVSEVSLKTIL